MRVEVVDNETPLSREVYRFWYIESWHRLVLDAFVRESRLSRRHSFKVWAFYARQKNRHYCGDKVVLDVVEIPARVAAEARAKFTAALTVGTGAP